MQKIYWKKYSLNGTTVDVKNKIKKGVNITFKLIALVVVITVGGTLVLSYLGINFLMTKIDPMYRSEA